MSSPDHRTARWLAFALLLVYLLTYSGLPYAVDEQSALTVTESILQHGLTVDGFTVNQMEWNQADVPPQNIGGVGGDLYSKKSLGVALLGVPLFALGQWLARAGVDVGPVQTVLLTNAFVTALTAYAFFLLVRALGYTRGTAIIGTLALGLGTPLWPYAKTFFSEPLGALGICVALLGAVRFRKRPLPSPPQPGEGADSSSAERLGIDQNRGPAVSAESQSPINQNPTPPPTKAQPLPPQGGGREGVPAGREGVLLSLGLALTVLAKSSNGVIALPIGLYLAYVILAERRDVLPPHTLARWAIALAGPLGLAVILTVAYNYVRFRTTLTFPLEPYELFNTPWLAGLRGLLFSPGESLLIFIPLTWLIPFGALRWRRSRQVADMLLALGVVTVLLLLYTRWFDWRGGAAWAPRMIMPAAPALVMLALPALGWLGERAAAAGIYLWRQIGVALVLATSIAIQLPGALTHFTREEGRDTVNKIKLNMRIWDVEHAAWLTYWPRIAERPDPAWLQPGFWALGAWRALWVILLAALVTLVGWRLWRAPGQRSRRSMPLAAAVAAGLLMIAIAAGVALASSADPRRAEVVGSELALDKAETTQALLDYLETAVSPNDLVIVDLEPLDDLSARMWAWMNAAPRYSYVGWLRREPTLDEASQAKLERWLSEYDAAWLVLHNTIPDFANSTTERWLNRWAFWSAQQWVGNQRAVRYLLPVDGPPLSMLDDPTAFGEAVVLLHARTWRGRDEDHALVELSWADAAPENLRVSVQALSPEGALLAQVDRVPGELGSAGEAVNRVGLVVEAEAYLLIAKVYDANSGALLPVALTDGVTGEYVVLAVVE